MKIFSEMETLCVKFELYTVRKSLRFSWVLESLTLKERERERERERFANPYIYISQRESGMQSLFIIGESGYVLIFNILSFDEKRRENDERSTDRF